MAPALVTDKLNTRVNCAALRVFVHIIFWGESNRRRRSAAFLELSARIIRARPHAEVGPAVLCVRICGADLCSGAARRRAREGNGGKLRFLPWLGGKCSPPADPQPTPYPQRGREPDGGRPVRRAQFFPVFVRVNAVPPHMIHRRRFYGHFAGGSPGAASCDVLRIPRVTSRVVSRLSWVRGVPSSFARVQASPLFGADGWPQNQPPRGPLPPAGCKKST